MTDTEPTHPDTGVETDSSAAAPTASPAQHDTAAGVENAPAVPPDASGPTPPLSMAPNLDPPFRVRNPSRIVGPALWIHGALLWSYVVLGELVVSRKFPEPLAWLIVLGVFVRTWFVAVRHLPRDSANLWRRIVSGVLALAIYFFAMAFTTAILGGGGRSGVEALTILLWFFALGSYALGRRMTRAPRPRPSEFSRPLALGLWTVSGASTLVALLSALDRM